MNQSSRQQELARVNVHEVIEKASSKKEIYNFLTLECEAYLPKIDTVNIFFLKEIMRAQKEVRTINVGPFVVH